MPFGTALLACPVCLFRKGDMGGFLSSPHPLT
jgi:hypothetical protein